jgi:signal peptidase II
MTDDPSTVAEPTSIEDGASTGAVSVVARPMGRLSGILSMWPSLVLAAAWLIVDQWSKHWAVNELTDRDVDVVGSLRLNLHYNSGMAFGRGTGLGPVIGVVALFVVVGMVVSLRRSESRVSAAGVGLVIGGALGNVCDRLFRGEGWFRGAVVDFIDLQWFPIFNVADIGIDVGAGLLILGTLLAGRRASSRASQTIG